MKHHFYTAYKFFLTQLALYSESQSTSNSFFSTSKFKLSSENESGLDLESESIREELLTLVEPSLMEEIEEYLLANVT